jgi:hypothetical protein
MPPVTAFIGQFAAGLSGAEHFWTPVRRRSPNGAVLLPWSPNPASAGGACDPRLGEN